MDNYVVIKLVFNKVTPLKYVFSLACKIALEVAILNITCGISNLQADSWNVYSSL